MMLIQFVRKTLIFSIILSLVAFLIYYFVIPQHYIKAFPLIVLFFVLSTIAVHTILTKAGKLKVSRFSTYFIGSISVKLLIYIIFIIVYVLIDRSTAVPFLINFLILYIFYTVFETQSLLNDIKKQEQSGNQQ